ncbi:hypothetical protein [Pseudoxanthomonas sp. GM95]|uniref:hypothetical protein n=1 Tax=Pseudoxanthomonas sp. GM95 TaxID=1881043 RepID=UPI001587D6CB|nr:hypothetical protein [Pseudoxanthomonas sp. GM95]
MFRCAQREDRVSPDALYQRVFHAITELRRAQLDVVMHLERLLVMEDHDGPIVLASVSGPDGWFDDETLMGKHQISCSPYV